MMLGLDTSFTVVDEVRIVDPDDLQAILSDIAGAIDDLEAGFTTLEDRILALEEN